MDASVNHFHLFAEKKQKDLHIFLFLFIFAPILQNYNI